MRTGGQRGRGAGEITVSSSSTLGILNVFCAVASCGNFSPGPDQARPGQAQSEATRETEESKAKNNNNNFSQVFRSEACPSVPCLPCHVVFFQPVFIVFSSCSCSFSFSLSLSCLFFVFFSSFGNFYAALKWCNCCGCRFFCCYPTAASSSASSSSCSSSSYSSSFSRSSLKCSTWLRCAGFNTDWANWIALSIKLSSL